MSSIQTVSGNQVPVVLKREKSIEMPSLRSANELTNFRREAKTAKTKADRLALLQRYAEKRVVSNDPRSHAERRAAYQRGNPRGRSLVGQCWCCSGWASVYNHHVIQLQHGGSNSSLNIVRICGECHADIHPWLERPQERTQHAEPMFKYDDPLETLVARTRIEGLATPDGGWTRDVLATMGVPWPPPKGWKKQLERQAAGVGA
jgi:hypothetical protein